MAALERLVLVAALLKLVTATGLLANNFNSLEQRMAQPLPNLGDHHLVARQAGQGCISLVSISSSCAAATSSFASLPATSQLACYCATPTRFDSVISSCTAYLSTADPDSYSSFAGLLPNSPCQSLGFTGGGSGATTSSSRSITITATATRTVTSRTGTVTNTSDDPGAKACSSVLEVEDSCTTATPSLASAPFSEVLSCVCYSSGRFDPEQYDDPRGSCYEYLKTANPPLYQSFVRQGNTETAPCTSYGDGGVVIPGTTTTTRRATTTTTSRPGTTTTNISPTGNPPGGSAVSTNIRGASVMAFAGALTLVLALVL